jgi:pyruvate formate-lyase activating enzyme-like uncharacterized protein
MARKIQEIAAGSLVVGNLPRGCTMCEKGSKMVLFVTGLCNSNCFYCPLSQEKSGKDVVFADEIPVTNDSDVLYEVDAIGGEGAGFSGGDPLCRLDRTIHYISFLKANRGENFHIHLYTSITDVKIDVLRRLQDAGLDEIRFHPQTQDWTGIEKALQTNMDVGIEVPALPERLTTLKGLARRAEDVGVSFMNLNELEASETNFERLVALGMRLTSMDTASIAGSSTVAKQFVKWASKSLDELNVHYCTARFKDAVQMRKRLERRLERTRREFEEKDDSDPLLILGVVRAPHGSILTADDLESIAYILQTEFDVPSELMNVDMMRMRIELAPWILDKIVHQLKPLLTGMPPVEMGIAFEYPSWDRLQTMFDPF